MKKIKKQRYTFEDHLFDILSRIKHLLSHSDCFEMYDEVKPTELIVGFNFKIYLKTSSDIYNKLVLEKYNKFKYPYGFIVCEGYLVDNMNTHINPITLELINELIMNDIYHIPLNISTIKSILNNKNSNFKNLLLLNYIKDDRINFSKYIKYLKSIKNFISKHENRMIDVSHQDSKYLYKISLL